MSQDDARRDPPPPPLLTDPDEVARCLRPQPPPDRTQPTRYALPGLLARELLGDRVIKS